MTTYALRTSIFLLFVIVSVNVFSNTYYVATNGNDNWPGTKEKPWATWDRAFKTAYFPGDTTYIRGGLYYTTITVGKNNIAGTAAKPVCFFAYPGETPILDGRNCATSKAGIMFKNGDHIILKGLTVRNFYQLRYNDTNSFGIYLYRCGHVTIEQCTTHDIGYRGFYFYAPDSLYVYNCDSYNIVDSLSVTPGNAGDGYIMTGGGDTTDYAIFRGCRAWHVSDDGWDVHTNGYIEIDSCWAFNCGGYEDFKYGNGMKLNLSISLKRKMLSRQVTNCIMVYNGGNGLTTNDTDREAIPMNIYNNTSAFNGLFGNDGNGFAVLQTSGSTAEEKTRIFKNNISYANVGSDVFVAGHAYYSHSHNTWDSQVSLDQSDFVSLDTTGIRGARQANGSLPDLNGFLELKDNSDLIDAGIDLGFAFNGNAPDMGALEHNKYPLISITAPSSGSIFSEPESILISTYVSDPDGYIIKVVIYNNDQVLVELTSEPWSFNWQYPSIGNHIFRAIAFDNFNGISTSAEIFVTYKSSTIKLYPNPNDGIFTFVLNDPLQKTSEISTISLDGKLVYKGTMLEKEVLKQMDLSYIKPGFYTFILYKEEGHIWKKFIKY